MYNGKDRERQCRGGGEGGGLGYLHSKRGLGFELTPGPLTALTPLNPSPGPCPGFCTSPSPGPGVNTIPGPPIPGFTPPTFRLGLGLVGFGIMPMGLLTVLDPPINFPPNRGCGDGGD